MFVNQFLRAHIDGQLDREGMGAEIDTKRNGIQWTAQSSAKIHWWRWFMWFHIIFAIIFAE